MSNCSGRTPNRTAIFRMCRVTYRIRKIPQCSTSSSSAQTNRRRLDFGQRSGLRSSWRRCTFHAGCWRRLEIIHRQPNRRLAGRLRAFDTQKERQPDAQALRRENVGYHRNGAPHHRSLRRGNARRSASGIQMDWQGNRRCRARSICVRLRRVARLFGWHPRPRQRRRGGRDVAGRVGRPMARRMERHCTSNSIRCIGNSVTMPRANSRSPCPAPRECTTCKS